MLYIVKSTNDQAPTLAEAEEQLGLEAGTLDTDFAVILVDPAEKKYAVRAQQDLHDPYRLQSGYSDPAIAPFGPPLEDYVSTYDPPMNVNIQHVPPQWRFTDITLGFSPFMWKLRVDHIPFGNSITVQIGPLFLSITLPWRADEAMRKFDTDL